MNERSVPKFLVDQLTEGQLVWSPLDPQFDEAIIGSNPQDSQNFPIMKGFEGFQMALLDKFPNEKNAINKYIDLLKVSVF